MEASCETEGNKKESAYFLKIKPEKDPVARLFCFPYAGGSGQLFRTWGEHLPAGIELHAIELPGRGTRINEPPIPNMSELVEELGEGIQPLTDVPFAFFGHSMGALLGFELALWLRKNGVQMPAKLWLTGRGAPQVPDPNPPVHHLPDEEFVDELRRLEGTPPSLLEDRSIWKWVLPSVRADFQVFETYEYNPEPPLECPITVINGEEDTEIRVDHVEAWGRQTSQAFESRWMPGGHFFLHDLEESLVGEIGDWMCSEMGS